MPTCELIDTLKKTIRNVLVIDESKSCRKIHVMILTKLGLNVEQTDGTGEAVFHLVRNSLLEADRGKSYRFDLILIASIMRGMDGPETVQRIRQLGYKGIVIQVTSNTSEVDINHSLSCGINAVISKPLTISKFWLGFEECTQSLSTSYSKFPI